MHRHAESLVSPSAACRTTRLPASVMSLLCVWLLQACNSGADTAIDRAADDTALPRPRRRPGSMRGRRIRRCLAWDRPSAGSAISLTRYTSLTFNLPARHAAGTERQHALVRRRAGRHRAHVRRRQSGDCATTFVDITRASLGRRDGPARNGVSSGLSDRSARVPFVHARTGPREQLVSRISAFTPSDGGATLDPDSEQVLLTSISRKTITTAATSPSVRTAICTSAWATAAAAAISTAIPATASDSRRCSARCCASTSIRRRALRASRATNPFAARNPPIVSRRGPHAAANARRSMPGASAIPGAGVSIAATAICGSPTSARTRGKKSTSSQRGGNYGWRCREGAHDFNSGGTLGCGSGGTDRSGRRVRPHARHLDHRRLRLSRPAERHRCAGAICSRDFGSGSIWAWIPENASQPREPTQLLDHGLNISSFGEGNDGELYVVNYGGTLHRIVFQTQPPAARARDAERDGLRQHRRSEAARCRADSLRDQRAVLVGRCGQGSLDRRCPTARTSRCRPAATGISRTAPC